MIRSLYNDQCAGGGTYVGVRNGMLGEYPDVMTETFPLVISPPIPHDGFSFHPDLSPENREALINALLEIAATPDGTDLLSMLFVNYEGLVEQDHTLYLGLTSLIESVGLTPAQVWENYYH